MRAIAAARTPVVTAVGHETDTTLVDHVADVRAATPTDAAHRIVPEIGEQRRLDTLARLGDVPAAVLVGDRDRLTPPPCADSIAEALPGTELTVYPGAGHMLILERHAEVSAILTAIVERAATSTPGQRRRRARRARKAGRLGQAA